MIDDYLIVGAGAAGSVLANRLTASGRSQVTVLEAGRDVVPGREPADIRNIFPLSAFNQDYVWTDTRVHWRRGAHGPAVPLSQGRLVGGSSQIMGMWAMRGHPNDYEGWAAAGATGWAWSDVLPYFRRLETDVDFAGSLHGRNGPLPIRRERPDERTAIARAVHCDAMRNGWRDIADMNGEFGDGHCALPITRELTSRASAGLHYLTAAVRGRPNLRLLANTEVERLLIEDGRVVGVVARERDGKLTQYLARTTIMAAGALRTPALLMRSGIGDPRGLRDAGVETLHPLPGVGRNLRNHAVVYLVGMLTRAGLDPPGKRPAGSTILRWTSGVAGTPPADMAMYVRSYLSWHALGRRMASLAPCLMRPASAGQISLRSPSSDDAPLIEFDMLSDRRDRERLSDGFRRAAAIFDTLEDGGLTGPPMVLGEAAGLGRYNTLSRGNALRAWGASTLLDVAPMIGEAFLRRLARMTAVRDLLNDETALDQFIERSVSGTGHVCGTCRIGARNDPLAVVDPLGKVHGLVGLMAADASVMPDVPSGNTHLPTVMVAEKIAAGLTGELA